MERILSYRRGFRQLPSAAQDRDLLWVFGGPKGIQVTGLEANSIDEEVTTPSGADEPHEPPKASIPEGKVTSATGSASDPHEPPKVSIPEGEVTSATESASDPHEPPKAAIPEGEVTSASEPHEPPKAAIPEGEVTTESSSPLALAGDSPPRPPPNKKRTHNQTHRRQSQQGWGPTVPVQHIFTDDALKICEKACCFLMGVGTNRVQRVLHGLPDRRRRGHRAPNNHEMFTSPQTQTCLQFLWRKYHFDAEGLPDKFCIARKDGKSLTIGPLGTHRPQPLVVPARSSIHTAEQEPQLEPNAVEEEEERAIATMALHATSVGDPNTMAVTGPGTQWGPPRYIGVMKPVHLYLELESWCAKSNLPRPSFSTFLRALDRCNCVRFRKTAGQHANCDQCTQFKKLLQSARHPQQRAAVMDNYCSHLLAQWMDRAVDSHHAEISLTCRQMLGMGHFLTTLARQFSHVLMRLDGVDQAKFRVPRQLVKTHAFEQLIRPALHVQGGWVQGFAFHLAVADADMKKDTNNNVEVLARLLESIYLKWQALPLSLMLIQDNTCRECKNQKILKFCVRVVGQGIMDSIVCCYPEKGHTHGPLDGSFGQLCVKLANAEFEDDESVVDILNNFLIDVGLDAGSKEGAVAYKLDEAARWIEWAEETNLRMSALTGPAAPHYFRICRRRHVGLGGPAGDASAEQRAEHLADHRGLQPNGDDVVMIVKDRMASAEISQIILMTPAADLPRLRGLPLQPSGIHDRRPATDTDRKKTRDAALAAREAGAISTKARDYLTQWARGTRRRLPRPARYSFLEHRVGTMGDPQPINLGSPMPNVIQPVRVAALDGHAPLPLGDEEDDDADPGPLIIV